MDKNNPKLLTITTNLVKKDFELATENPFISEEELIQALADRVFYLIEHNLEQLFAILYRLDVNEQKVHLALHGNKEIAANVEIAELIVSRLREKAKTRLEYSSDEAGEEDVTPW